ncbi:TetR/AcrR family transcriptional regulator [Sodalis sp. RH21]|uniref:TetR/AcrR family transcriptional regulator n=1 Tax=unclassified Sodalis (in: enterobacteria) TaxID=2636512 RepID=UPI0039B5EBEA
MRVTREQAAINRERVLHQAAEMFREHGIDSVSIADVMKSAELTHGGFYKQFDSKEALAREACSRGLAQSIGALYDTAAAAPANPLRRVAEAYLSAEHRTSAGSGCTLSALAADAGRGSPELQEVFAKGAIAMARALHEIAGRTAEGAAAPPAPAEQDLPDFALLSSLVGAVILARAVGAARPALADRILADTLNPIAGAEKKP